MTDTHTLESVQPATADLLGRTAESKGVSVDRLLREMLVVYTSVELQHVTADLQQVLRGEMSSEGTDTFEPDLACPYCRCSGTIDVGCLYLNYPVCHCLNVYCPLDTFVNIETAVRDREVRMIVEIMDSPE